MFNVENIDYLIKNEILYKSNYKRICSICNNNINRGDLVTRVEECSGIELRPNNNTTKFLDSRIVHKDCNPEDCWSTYEAHNESYNFTDKSVKKIKSINLYETNWNDNEEREILKKMLEGEAYCKIIKPIFLDNESEYNKTNLVKALDCIYTEIIGNVLDYQEVKINNIWGHCDKVIITRSHYNPYKYTIKYVQ